MKTNNKDKNNVRDVLNNYRKTDESKDDDEGDDDYENKNDNVDEDIDGDGDGYGDDENIGGSQPLKFSSDEKELFSVETDFLETNRLNIAGTLFLIIGFPFYSVITFISIIGFIQERSQNDIISEITYPLSALGIILFIAIVIASYDWKKFLPTKERTVITNKRIYSEYVMPNKTVKAMELKSSPYADIQSIMAVSDKTGDYLRVIMKPGFIPKDGLESSQTSSAEAFGHDRKYKVKNAKAAYMQIPDTVKFAQGETSKATKKFKEKNKFEGVFAILFSFIFLGALASFSIFFNAQERSSDFLKKGRKAYALKQFDVAESDLRQAYNSVAALPFMTQYGMASYRYALALEANGKLDEAIPKFRQAVEKCNWADSESDISWKPAVFRSNTHLADIYVKKGDDKLARKYFEAALNSAPLETEEKRVKKFFANYENYLRKRNEIKEAHRIEVSAKIFANTEPERRRRTFRE